MKRRIIGYDLARSLAIIGMVVVNFKVVMGAEQDGPAWLVGLVGLLDGRAAATFVVLAGAGSRCFLNEGARWEIVTDSRKTAARCSSGRSSFWSLAYCMRRFGLLTSSTSMGSTLPLLLSC